MEFEQLVKRLEWLDEEHRKTRTSLITLEERMAALEGNIETVAKQIKPFSKQIADIASTAARLDQFDKIFAKQREDLNKALEDIEQRHVKRESEVAKRHQEDFKPFYKAIEELRQSIENEFPPIKRDIKARILEESRLNAAIKELKPPIDDAVRIAQEAIRTQHVFDENRKTEAKRVADLQGEITAVRKRAEEARERAELTADGFKNIDNRIKELQLSEAERKAAQTAFIEGQTIGQIDRERTYKEWKEKFDTVKQQAQALDTQILNLEETLRTAKRAQETYNELNTKLERRINEMTEMQRLAEDRLRQEWVTFKADDQKRWTGYTLSQDEGTKDVRRLMQKLEERISPFDDRFQTLQDQILQTTEVTEAQLQEFMNVAHEWLSAYERIMGHGKATKKTTKK
jgi:chromosome segregation ATPase